MKRLWKWITRSLLGLVITAVVALVIGLGALFSGSLPLIPAPLQTLDVVPTLAFQVTLRADVFEPEMRFAQIDPAIVNVLAFAPREEAVILRAVQPVGAYLPRSGNIYTTLPEPTPPPTPLPYPTSPPLPLPTLVPLPTNVLPTATATFVAAFTPQPTVPVPTEVVSTGGECVPDGLPVDGLLTQRYHAYHQGIDLGVPVGTPVLSTQSGMVTYADWSPIGYGYLVIIQNANFTTYYAHNNAFNVSAGQFVGRGDVIAFSGSTGNSSGPHVHYEIRIDDVTVDPLTFDVRSYSRC